jgi:hypothetical protein
MNLSHAHELSELPEITRRDRARFVKEARRLRAAEIDKLLSTIGRGVARLGRALMARKPMQGGLTKA